MTTKALNKVLEITKEMGRGDVWIWTDDGRNESYEFNGDAEYSAEDDLFIYTSDLGTHIIAVEHIVKITF